jgi:hypothetical protein
MGVYLRYDYVKGLYSRDRRMELNSLSNEYLFNLLLGWYIELNITLLMKPYIVRSRTNTSYTKKDTQTELT